MMRCSESTAEEVVEIHDLVKLTQEEEGNISNWKHGHSLVTYDVSKAAFGKPFCITSALELQEKRGEGKFIYGGLLYPLTFL